jgi:hypothetical protein
MTDEKVVGEAEDTSEIAVEGVEPSPPDERDFGLKDVLPEPGKVRLPPRHDPATRWPMYRQGNKPHCVAATGAQISTVATFRRREQIATFDFRELYDECKKIDGLKAGAQGTTARACLKVLRKRGALLADPSKIDGKTVVQIDKFARLNGRREIKVAVHESGSAFVITRWYRNWNTAGVPASGILPEPKNHYIDHAWTVIGWDDNKATPAGKGAFLMRNSLGKRWGDNGNGWLPYQFVQRVLKEAWQAVTPVAVLIDETRGAARKEDPTVKLLLNVVPGQLGRIGANTPVLHPETLSEVTKIAASNEARLVGETEDGTFRGIIVSTRHLPGGTAQKPVSGLLLVEAARVSNIRSGE